MSLGGRLRGPMPATLLAAALSLALAAPAGAVSIDAATRSVTASRVSMSFSTGEPDVVRSLQWVGSGGAAGADLVHDSGSATCGDPAEPRTFWGESYGDGAKATPELVLGGATESWSSPSADTVQTETRYPTACSGYEAAVPVRTTYTFYDEGPQASEIAVRRTWGFDLAHPPTGSATGFRAYAPTLPLREFAQVLYPAAGGLQTLDITTTQCAQPACVRELEGSWFAINDGTAGEARYGSGMIVLRDSGDAAGAKLAIQGLYENAANPLPAANVSAIDLPIPPGGLVAPVSETEYLCFYDAVSWPQSEREALRLPPGCGPVAPPGETPGSQGAPPAATPPGTAAPAATTPPATPPPGPLPSPAAFRAFNVEPAGGDVLVRPPGAGAFVALADAEQIPLGTIVDARHGSVRLTSAKDAHGKTESGLFHGGVFRVTQVRARSGVRGGRSVILTVLTLVGPLPSCPAAHAAAAHSRHPPRRLWGNAKGNFRTVGHDASATVRGTQWLTEDTCGGTLVRVTRGVVSVADFPHRRSFLLRAPHAFRAHPGHGG